MSTEFSIDGSQGEGGGQIVRSALTLSLLTGRSVTVYKIRAGRQRPGLGRQHLASVQGAVTISGGRVSGAEMGSGSFAFEPGPVSAGEYQFRVGTAGSATLVLQTVLPALLCAAGPSTLILEGGTHNPWAPPVDFLERAFLPLLRRMGPRVELTPERCGFYPAGGGRFRVQVQPAGALQGFDLLERGAELEHGVRILLSRLPLHIARRELGVVLAKTGWDEDCGTIEEVAAAGPGNAVLLHLVFQNVTEVFSGFGQQGVKAEQVAAGAVRQLRDYLSGSAPVGPYLADQLLLPLAISAWQNHDPNAGRQRGGVFRTSRLTRHSTTQIDLLQMFLGVGIDVEDEGEDCQTVRVTPAGASGRG
ncbi:MAG: RNA 3'-terminal phosphate cyclase [Planctomycetales bacterium]